VSFSGVVLALGAILAPTEVSIPRDYIALFAAAPLVMVVFALTKSITPVDGVVLRVLFVAFVAYIAVKELKRETATFRNLEVLEELDEDDESDTTDPVRAQALSTMSVFGKQGRFRGWVNLGLAVVALCGIIIGAATVSTGTEQILERYGI